MSDIVIKILIGLAGLINLAPVFGVISRQKIETLYGLDVSDPNLEILMRHRAVLFGIVGGFMIYAAITSTLQFWAIGGGMVSMVSFIILSKAAGLYSSHIKKVITADYIGILCLAIAALMLLI